MWLVTPTPPKLGPYDYHMTVIGSTFWGLGLPTSPIQIVGKESDGIRYLGEIFPRTVDSRMRSSQTANAKPQALELCLLLVNPGAIPRPLILEVPIKHLIINEGLRANLWLSGSGMASEAPNPKW